MHVAAVFRQRLCRQCFGPGDGVAMYPAAKALCAHAVLYRRDLHPVPVLDKGAEDAAVAGKLTVIVVCPFPRAHGGEVLRLPSGNPPLVHAVIRYPVQPDLAVRPGAGTGPFDAGLEIVCFQRRPRIEVTRRATGAPAVHAHAGIVVRYPKFGIDGLPALVLVGGILDGIGMVGGEQIPGGGIELILPGQSLAIGAHGHDDRKLPLLIRTIDVGAENGAVRQGDRQVPVDAHSVAQLCPGPVLRLFLRAANVAFARRGFIRCCLFRYGFSGWCCAGR